ncbi:MAG: DUF418 domain-containing protein [Massilibacteroides sp.]|nr:DUF418 domain-containing protein [Massilibacteroides sp.]
MDTTAKRAPRIKMVDALRGFAVMAIILLHNVEHFNFCNFPASDIPWLQTLNLQITDMMYFLFGGKAYAIFSLLFGFSYFIQLRNRQHRGQDFSWRFMWRVFLLLLLGFLNGSFFPGEILVLYALMAFILPLVRKWSNKAVLILAIILFLQPLEWVKVFSALLHPDVIPTKALWLEYFRNMKPALSQPNLWVLLKSNFWDGQLFSLLWAWSHGRFFQTMALFLFGFLVGRKGYFADIKTHTRFWSKALMISFICFFPLFLLVTALPDMGLPKIAVAPLNTIMSSFRNFSMMVVWVSGFVLLWQGLKDGGLLKQLIPYGKMSLTNYLTQGMIGSFIYFDYGLSLYDKLGSTASILVGFVLFFLQLAFCNYWLRHFKYGPFEYIWRKATWKFLPNL